MSDVTELGRSSWRQLDRAWSGALEGWNDGTTRYFQAHFWAPLESEVHAYELALETLMETLARDRG